MRDEADLEIGSRSQPDAAQMAEPDPVLPEPVPFGPGSPRKVDELEREIWLGGEAVDSGLDLGWEGAAAVADPNVARCATLRPVTEAPSAAEVEPGEEQQGEGAAEGEGVGADGEAADEGEFRFFYESVVPLYGAVVSRMQQGSGHNYDDVNEAFWAPRCLVWLGLGLG